MAIEELLGELPDGWRYTTLGAACERGGGDVQTGPFGSQLHAADYVEAGIPSIMPMNIGDNRISESDIARITPSDAQRLGRYLVRTGDIVYSRRGDVERRALIREREDGWLCGTGCLRVRLGPDGPDPRYASFYLGHPAVREWIVRHAHGATMPNLNTSILSECPFVSPPPYEQRAIAHILGSLDDKIELNRRMSETLESIARALFQSWLVDFDPVRAKSEARDTGLPKHIADLFPDSFDESEVGKIPKGWSAKTVEEIATRVGMGPFGSSIKVESFVSRGIPVISGQHLRGLMMEDTTFKFVTEEHAEKLKAANVQRGDVVFTHAGNIGQVAYIPEYSRYDRYVISQRQFFVRCAPAQVTPTFFTFYFKSPEGQYRLLANASSSGVPSIARPVTYLRSIRLTVPSRPVMNAFERMVEPLLTQVRRNMDQEGTLAALRDTLLPKLISGEVRVNRGEQHVTGVTA